MCDTSLLADERCKNVKILGKDVPINEAYKIIENDFNYIKEMPSTHVALLLSNDSKIIDTLDRWKELHLYQTIQDFTNFIENGFYCNLPESIKCKLVPYLSVYNVLDETLLTYIKAEFNSSMCGNDIKSFIAKYSSAIENNPELVLTVAQESHSLYILDSKVYLSKDTVEKLINIEKNRDQTEWHILYSNVTKLTTEDRAFLFSECLKILLLQCAEKGSMSGWDTDKAKPAYTYKYVNTSLLNDTEWIERFMQTKACENNPGIMDKILKFFYSTDFNRLTDETIETIAKYRGDYVLDNFKLEFLSDKTIENLLEYDCHRVLSLCSSTIEGCDRSFAEPLGRVKEIKEKGLLWVATNCYKFDYTESRSTRHKYRELLQCMEKDILKKVCIGRATLKSLGFSQQYLNTVVPLLTGNLTFVSLLSEDDRVSYLSSMDFRSASIEYFTEEMFNELDASLQIYFIQEVINIYSSLGTLNGICITNKIASTLIKNKESNIKYLIGYLDDTTIIDILDNSPDIISEIDINTLSKNVKKALAEKLSSTDMFRMFNLGDIKELV